MNTIELLKIEKNGCDLQYIFEYSEGLKKFFSGSKFSITYPEVIEKVPDGILAIPFVSNTLQIAWLADCELIIPELDRDFYESIPAFLEGYRAMFPETVFAGKVSVRSIEECPPPENKKSAVFFSGGLDATQTLVSHFEEKPDLISIWGADISYGNKEGWEVVHARISEVAHRFNLADVVIHSSFRQFDDEGELGAAFSGQLKDSWWHGVKHGIGLLGHAAPYAYLNGISTVYIASSNCPADGPVRCASNPLIDNYVRFAKCKVIHDGFEFSRQDKVHNVVRFQKMTGHRMTLHVCWESQGGKNCCCCEKCYRTIAGLIAEGAEPIEYGFDRAIQMLPQMKQGVLGSGRFNAFISETQWAHIKDVFLRNQDELRKLPYWKHIRWIIKTDFSHFENIKIPLIRRIKNQLRKTKFACSVYDKLKK